jgi:hypothetical protein
MENENPEPAGEPCLQYFKTLCNRRILGDPKYFPRAEYLGRTFHFCMDVCLDAFLNDPDVFIRTHSRGGEDEEIIRSG